MLLLFRIGSYVTIAHIERGEQFWKLELAVWENAQVAINSVCIKRYAILLLIFKSMMDNKCMLFQYSAQALYSQLAYFQAIFDWNAAISKLPKGQKGEGDFYVPFGLVLERSCYEAEKQLGEGLTRL